MKKRDSLRTASPTEVDYSGGGGTEGKGKHKKGLFRKVVSASLTTRELTRFEHEERKSFGLHKR